MTDERRKALMDIVQNSLCQYGLDLDDIYGLAECVEKAYEADNYKYLEGYDSEVVLQAVTKQKPRKYKINEFGDYICPRCYAWITRQKGANYCICCGQAIDWRKE